ncbi:EI24 domain-containing protein [Sphingomonas sp. LB-2]|uniref:EI24 domain-containing protein n=1 Tax=Sphingomonas caeni TaxID=2984949 RepID=UPI0022309C63|nr:EI24 domain-containing protein [Sphingomonas caeni]MCW3845945.1 EI24 domain-containing protein [Sphingomonas caeni]
MIQALFLSIGQLFDRRVAMVFVKSFALTIVLLGAVSVAIWYGMHQMLDWIALKLGGTGWLGWAENTADISTIVLVLLAHLLLFRAVAIAVIGVFADEVVEAVELRHYPGAHASARSVPFARSISMGLGSGLRAVLVNLLFSPIYLILLLTGIGTPIAFFLVNTWLLGRDLGDMVAVRHMPYGNLPRWRRRTIFTRAMLGALGTGLFLVPGLNLLAPILGAAMAAHAFHQGRR